MRRRVELDVRLRVRLRRGHRRQPRAVRQPGNADGEGVPGLHLLRCAPADADDHRAAQLPAGLRRARRQATVGGTGTAGARAARRLAEAREQAQREATNARDSRPGTAITLRNKDLELKDFYRETSPARGTWRATTATSGYSSAARRAGDKAGRRARLGNSAELAGARSALEK